MSDWRKEVKKDSPFLYHFDIEGHTPLKVRIEGYKDIEAFCPGKNARGLLWALTFAGKKKALGVNVTNGNLIESLHGPDKEGWIGKDIVLRVAECDGQKCIRIHAPGAKLPPQCKRFKYLDSAPGSATAAGKARTQPAQPAQDDQHEPDPAEVDPVAAEEARQLF